VFEHSLVDLESRPQARRRWISLPAAIAVHAVAFGVVGFISYWTVGPVAEAQENIVFLHAAPPPDTPAGPTRAPTPPPRGPQPQAPPQPQQQVVQPDNHIPEDIPPATPSDEPPANPGPAAPGPPSSGPPHSGCEGCPPGPGGPDPGPADNGPIVFRVGMTRPEIVHRVEPRYTEAARKIGLQGVVIVQAVIDEQGRVADVQVLRGLRMGLDEAAVAAIQQWRFTPALLAGKPVKVYYNLTINFQVLR
jgi:protein TonB